MSSTSASDVETYYQSKQAYGELLQAALANNDSPDQNRKPNDPSTKIHKSVKLPMFDSPEVSKSEDGPPPDVKAVAKKVAAMREASEKGKSKIKRTQWAQIDSLLG